MTTWKWKKNHDLFCGGTVLISTSTPSTQSGILFKSLYLCYGRHPSFVSFCFWCFFLNLIFLVFKNMLPSLLFFIHLFLQCYPPILQYKVPILPNLLLGAQQWLYCVFVCNCCCSYVEKSGAFGRWGDIHTSLDLKTTTYEQCNPLSSRAGF